MTEQFQELIQRLDREAEARYGPPTPPDPAQVQAKVRGHLIARGQGIAQDQDLGHVQDQDLHQLGRLDCIAQHPTLHPDLACTLEMIASEREHRARPRGLREIVPEGIEHRSGDGIDLGQDDSSAREEPETADQKKDLDRKRYWDRIVRDRPDEDWEPS